MYKKIKEGGIYWYKGNDEDRHDTSKYYLVMSSDDSEISVFAVPLHKKIRRRYLKEGMILDIPSFGGICTANCRYVHQLNRFRLGDLIATAPDEMLERVDKYLESNDTITFVHDVEIWRKEYEQE